MDPIRTSVHIISSLDPRSGGPSVSVPELAAAVTRDLRYENRLVTFSRRGEIVPPIEATPVETLPWRPAELLFGGDSYRALEALIKQTDVVHVHGIWQAHCTAAIRICRGHGIPFLVSAHGMLDPWAIRNRRWRKWIYSQLVERRNLSGASCLRALSLAEVEDYRAFGLQAPAALLPNGINIPAACADLFLERYPELADREIVLFLSRIQHKKGIHLLCRMWARVSRSFPTAQLVLAGPDEGNTVAEINRLISELGIQNSVTMTGMLDYGMKWSALHAATLFVLPSYSEGFSIAVLEAMGAGLPIIISSACHFPEVATKGCGVVIEPNERELECALLETLQAPSESRRAMGERGQRLVESEYNWQRIGSRTADVYDWMLGGPEPDSGILFHAAPSSSRQVALESK